MNRYKKYVKIQEKKKLFWATSSAVERIPDKNEVEGSTPSSPTKKMIILNHSLVGAVLATKTESLPVAFLLGFISHFVLDAIPHLDPGTIINPFGKKEISWPKWVYGCVLIDFLITIIIFYLLRNRPDFNLMIVAAIGAVSVDVIENFPSKFIRDLPILKQIQWLHTKVHFWLPTKMWCWGLLTSIIVLGGSLWYLLKF